MNGQWYFCTREGEQGPFRSKGAAEAGLRRFINEKIELGNFERSRHTHPAPPVRSEGKAPMALELVPIETETPAIEAPAMELLSLPKRPMQTRSLVF